MIFGIGLNIGERLKESQARAQLAEELGVGYVWISDSPALRYPFVVASAIAEVTNRIRIGIGVISPFIHTPSHIHRSLSAITEHYGKRFELCIGLGDRNGMREVGIRLPRHEDAVKMISNTRDEVKYTLLPLDKDFKIWLAAQGPKTLTSAIGYDGVILNYASPKMIQWALGHVQDRLGSMDVGISAPAYIYEKPDEAMMTKLRNATLTILMGASPRLARQLGYEDEVRSISARLRPDITFKERASLLPEDIARELSITMSSRDLPAYLDAIEKIGVRHVVFGPPQTSTLEGIKLICDAVQDR